MSLPSLTNLESLLQAAEAESSLMSESVPTSEPIETLSVPSSDIKPKSISSSDIKADSVYSDIKLESAKRSRQLLSAELREAHFSDTKPDSVSLDIQLEFTKGNGQLHEAYSSDIKHESISNHDVKSESTYIFPEPIAKIIESAASKSNQLLPQIPGNILSDNKQQIAAEVKAALNQTNLSSMLNRMSNNPEEVSNIMEQSMNQMSPEMMEQARKMAMGGQGQQIIQEMKRRGMDPNAMKSQFLEHQKNMRALKSENTKRVVLITGNRQLKMRTIPIDSVQLSATNIIKPGEHGNLVELSCSRLASGPLQGKTIKVWCDTNRKGKNKRLTKIVGFSVAGEGLVVMEEGDIDEKDFIAAERLLQ